MLSTRYLLSRQRACNTFKSSLARCRLYATDGATKPKSGHSQLYSDTLPAMIPVFLLGSAVYLGLQLAQLNLSHEKYMEEAADRVIALEAEIEALQAKRECQLEPTSNADNTPTKSHRGRWW